MCYMSDDFREGLDAFLVEAQTQLAGEIAMGAESKGPLAGMRVIELAHIMAGPVCGLMLADMGADVIKVEKPQGDDTRRFTPPESRASPPPS